MLATRILSFLTILTISACGEPCLPITNGDVFSILADECINTTIVVESSDAGDESSTTDNAATTGDACDPPATDELACATMPQPGQGWGACLTGNMCDSGNTCKVTDLGSVCLPECDDCGCSDFGCFGGECSTEGQCAPACNESADDCPVRGMECDPKAGVCVYPTVNPPMCQPPAGAAWGACNGGTCEAGSICVPTKAGDICAPDYNAGPCSNSKCMPTDPGAEIVTLSASSIVCGYQCADSSDCDNGMICGQTQTAKICMWPQ